MTSHWQSLGHPFSWLSMPGHGVSAVLQQSDPLSDDRVMRKGGLSARRPFLALLTQGNPAAILSLFLNSQFSHPQGQAQCCTPSGSWRSIWPSRPSTAQPPTHAGE